MFPRITDNYQHGNLEIDSRRLIPLSADIEEFRRTKALL